MMGAAAFMVLALAAASPQEPAPAAAESDAARHLIFLAENRPIFLRLRVTYQGRPFEASWIDSVRTLHASLPSSMLYSAIESAPKFATHKVPLSRLTIPRTGLLPMVYVPPTSLVQVEISEMLSEPKFETKISPPSGFIAR